MKRKRLSQKKKTIVTRQTIKLCLACLMIVLGIIFLNHFLPSQPFSINHVNVYGVKKVNAEELKRDLLSLFQGGFFQVNVAHIQKHLLLMTWVKEAYVRKIWPDQIEIVLIEKNPIAFWNDKILLSDTGELFEPSKESIPLNLPQFIGPQGKHLLMFEYFMEMNRLFASLHVKISYLELTAYANWKVRLNNGIRLEIGHQHILNRLRHLVTVYPTIIGQHVNDVDYIDLRYSNGVAVRWKRLTHA